MTLGPEQADRLALASILYARRALAAGERFQGPNTTALRRLAGDESGLSNAERWDVCDRLGAAGELSDGELEGRMANLAGKSHQPVPPLRPLAERKIVDRAERKSATVAEAPVQAGSFEGYASTWTDNGGPDQGGDIVKPGAFTRWVQRVNAGEVVTAVVAGGEAGHSNAPMSVVGHVVRAGQDRVGLWVHAALTTDADTQVLRTKMKDGALRGLSIQYNSGKTRLVKMPDGTAARELDDIWVHHIALTPIPMNRSAQITMVKTSGWPGGLAGAAEVVTPAELVEVEGRRRDPDRERLERMAKMVRAAGWPAPELVAQLGVETAYGMLEDAARAKAMRQVEHDPVRAAAAARRDRANDYCFGLRAAMARGRDPGGCGTCFYCRADSPGCIYG